MPDEIETNNSTQSTSEKTQETITPETESAEEQKTSEESKPAEEKDSLLTKKEETKEEFVPITPDDIVIPEGFEKSEALMTSFVDIVNEHKVSKEATNALVEAYSAEVQRVMESASEERETAFDEMHTKWQEEAKALPEIGGDNFDKTISSIQTLMKNEMGKDIGKLEDALSLTGAGNHPALIQFLAGVAQKLNEPGPVTGKPNEVVAGPENRANRMFPTMQNQE